MAYNFKNPFLSRFSDRTGLSNSMFLSMYAPQIVRKLLNIEHLLLPKATWLIGTPGSGKSSILRLFGIDILIDIVRQRSTYPHIYDVLSEAKIIEDDIIKSIGLYIQIDELYAETANVSISGISNDQLFNTLFDIRVAKKVIHTIESYNNFKSISNSEIIIRGVESEQFPPQIFANNQTIDQFKKKVYEKESLIAGLLNSFPGAPLPKNLELHNRISSLDLIQEQKRSQDVEFFLMIDDSHDLYPSQFKILKTVLEKRNSFPRWIATRKHIYPIAALLGSGSNATDEREVFTLDLDVVLNDTSLYKKFIKILVDRRLNFTSMLNEFTSENIEAMIAKEEPVDLDKAKIAIEQQKDEAKKLASKFKYQVPDFDVYFKGKNPTSIEGEIFLIKAYRTSNKKQLSLFPELEAKNDFAYSEAPSKDRHAAELFLKKRLKIPLYSGFDNIISISNNNVEQFMRVFSPFIDRLIYRVEINKNTSILPNEQFKILRNIVKNYINNVILRLYLGNNIYQLIQNLGNYFQLRSYEPNAPHAPGITQFAILASDIYKIKDEKFRAKPWIKKLSDILTVAISHNILIPEQSVKQGAAGSELKHPFSLNRLLCVSFSLPLQKGDFQIIPIELLYEMCNRHTKPDEIKKRKASKQLTILDDL